MKCILNYIQFSTLVFNFHRNYRFVSALSLDISKMWHWFYDLFNGHSKCRTIYVTKSTIIMNTFYKYPFKHSTRWHFGNIWKSNRSLILILPMSKFKYMCFLNPHLWHLISIQNCVRLEYIINQSKRPFIRHSMVDEGRKPESKNRFRLICSYN